MKIEPTLDRCVIRPDVPLGETSGGILLPDSAKKPTLMGKVVSVGPGKQDKNGILRPMSVTAGQRVAYKSYASHETENMEILEGCILVNECDLIAVILD